MLVNLLPFAIIQSLAIGPRAGRARQRLPRSRCRARPAVPARPRPRAGPVPACPGGVRRAACRDRARPRAGTGPAPCCGVPGPASPAPCRVPGPCRAACRERIYRAGTPVPAVPGPRPGAGPSCRGPSPGEYGGRVGSKLESVEFRTPGPGRLQPEATKGGRPHEPPWISAGQVANSASLGFSCPEASTISIVRGCGHHYTPLLSLPHLTVLESLHGGMLVRVTTPALWWIFATRIFAAFSPVGRVRVHSPVGFTRRRGPGRGPKYRRQLPLTSVWRKGHFTVLRSRFRRDFWQFHRRHKKSPCLEGWRDKPV